MCRRRSQSLVAGLVPAPLGGTSRAHVLCCAAPMLVLRWVSVVIYSYILPSCLHDAMAMMSQGRVSTRRLLGSYVFVCPRQLLPQIRGECSLVIPRAPDLSHTMGVESTPLQWHRIQRAPCEGVGQRSPRSPACRLCGEMATWRHSVCWHVRSVGGAWHAYLDPPWSNLPLL